MSIQYTKIFHCKTIQNLPKLRYLVSNIYHLAVLHISKITIYKCTRVEQGFKTRSKGQRRYVPTDCWQ
jgi:hypothetical protein